MRGQPAFQALGRGQPAVQRHHLARAQLGKAGFKARLQLRREVDLGHHHQHLGAGVVGQHLGSRAQVHLGFAAAGGAKQQRGAGVQRKLAQRLGLLRTERGAGLVCISG